MVVWRRTLFCKIGQTGAVADWCKELARIVMAAVGARAGAIGHQGPGPDEVRFYEVLGHMENREG
jgi:hypothetical protein